MSVIEEETNENNEFVYDVNISILNLDGDLSDWILNFDVPSNCNVTTTSENYDINILEKTITLKSADENSFISNGAELSLNLTFSFNTKVDFNIDNVILNNKIVNYNK